MTTLVRVIRETKQEKPTRPVYKENWRKPYNQNTTYRPRGLWSRTTRADDTPAQARRGITQNRKLPKLPLRHRHRSRDHAHWREPETTQTQHTGPKAAHHSSQRPIRPSRKGHHSKQKAPGAAAPTSKLVPRPRTLARTGNNPNTTHRP